MRLIDGDKLLNDLNRELEFNREINNQDRIFHLLSFIVDVESANTIDESKEIEQLKSEAHAECGDCIIHEHTIQQLTEERDRLTSENRQLRIERDDLSALLSQLEGESK